MPSTALTLPLSTPLQPPLKWAGGKRWLVPHLTRLWHPFSAERFVEPFAGAAGISLGLAPTRALLNDNNPHVINFFNWLKRGLVITKQGLEDEITKNGEPAGNPTNGAANPGAFQARLWMENDRELYYAHRKRFNELLAGQGSQSAEAAALFYYLNRTGFNGLCRFNRRGQFNVPFGKYQNINYTRDFSPYQRLMANWQFTSVDFEKVPLEPTDFIYADPPFDVEFTQYSREGFCWEEQVRTAEWLSRHPGPVALSNQSTSRIVDLYTKLGYRLTYLKAPRRISCTGDRTPATEVLATRNL